jgi:hypothetical protein
MTRIFLGMFAAVVLAVTGASAQLVDLTGQYRCLEQCRDDQPAFITQNGRELNLLNEAGEPSRAWIDWPGHIWAHHFNEGAVFSPDGMILRFDRGAVWQRELEPEVAPVPRTRTRPLTRGTPNAAPAARVAQPAARGAAPAPRTAVAPATAFDGAWSVLINTQSGPCDPQYRLGVRIVNGNIIHEGGGVANAQGQVAANGNVWVSVSSGGQSASGQGRLARDSGTGTWSGQGSAGTCVGTWQAVRRG